MKVASHLSNSISSGKLRHLISSTRRLIGLTLSIRLFPAIFILLTTTYANAQSANNADHPGQVSPSTISCSLVNGDRVSGLVLSASSGAISIGSEHLGQVTVQRKAVTSCHTEDRELARRISGFISPSPGKSESMRGPVTDMNPSNSMRPPDGKLNADPSQNPRSQPKSTTGSTRQEPWRRTFGFNYAFAHGNSNISDLNLSGGVEYKGRENGLRVAGLFRRGKKDGRDSANLFTTSARYDRKITREFFSFTGSSYFTEVNYEKDLLKKLDHRMAWNGGVSMPLLKKDTKELAFDLGGGVTREIYSTGLARTLGAGLLRLTGERPLFRRARVKQTIALFPDFADMGRYRLHADIFFRTPLTKYLSVQISTLNRFDSRPEGNVKRNDISILSGLAIEF